MHTDDISYLVAESGFKDVGVTTTQIDLDLPRAAPLPVQDAIPQRVSQ